MHKDAVLSECGRYRYLLTRGWDLDKPSVAFVMLNPSTADATVDDPTIRRCLGFARAWGFGRLQVVNLFAWRATDPAELVECGDPVGQETDGHILEAVLQSRRIVAAWGAGVPKLYENRPAVVRRLVYDAGGTVLCLGITKGGEPRHPLYVRGDTEPVRYRLPKRKT